MGRKSKKRGNIGIHIADSLCCNSRSQCIIVKRLYSNKDQFKNKAITETYMLKAR